ncbi:MAG: beta-propeller domain-containing protein [Candidatus Moranbacteria bacterium]|nr:beta-propeller domain-containing protein [Candidatus Moranbacteria bacterium]
MENENSTSKIENNKKSIESLKQKLIIVAGVIIAVIFAILVFLIFKNKKQDLGIKENKIDDKVISEVIEEKDQLIKKFSDYNELRDFLESNSSDDTIKTLQYESDTIAVGMAMGEESGMTRASNIETKANFAPQTEEQSSHSETNVQVQGVDEADIVKTDGDYIYVVSKKNLFIVDSKNAENLNILSKLEFDDQPQNIYLNGDRLIVFGRNNEIRKKEIYSNFKRRSQYTFFKVFDISDRKNPRQLKNYDFEGNYSNSRMIGDYVYFLTNASNINYADEFPVPRVLLDGQEIYNYSDEQNCLGGCPDVYYVDDISDRYTMVNVMAINVQDINKTSENNLNHKVYLMPYNQNLYVSHDNLYLTYTKYFDQNEFLTNLKLEIIWDKLSANDKNKIEKIKSSEYFILSRREKTYKIQNILNRVIISEEDEIALEENLKNKIQELYPQIVDKIEETVIHKIAIDGENLEYKGFGSVSGTILNQFSMDENGDFFRIATTRSQNRMYWLRSYLAENIQIQLQGESYNNLYVLDKNLKITGRLEGLAEGERIYSVRFMGDRAYMVTFRQTDPLFVIDLQNPNNPKVLGKLKIPGFSNYLHPYDKNHLIGIGKDTKENSFGGVVTGGLKISLFDVSDVANPKEKAKYILGGKGSDSIALRDHKAVLFDKEKNLLVLPVTLRDNFSDENFIDKRFAQEKYFVGAAVFNIDDSKIDLRGVISHSKNNVDNWCLGNCYTDNILRSLWIGDVLYSFSNGFLQANGISDLELIKKLELRFNGRDDFRVVN